MKYIFSIFALAFSITLNAQNTNDDFQQFRKDMLSDYNGFRKSVLDNYADYLNSVWKDYQSFRGVKRDDTPKPTTPPDIKTKPAKDTPVSKPVVKAPKPTTPTRPTAPAAPSTPATPAPPTMPASPQAQPTVPFSFYGITLKAPRLECVNVGNSTSPHTVSSAWKKYEGKGMKKVAAALQTEANSLGLNDWFTYELVRQSVRSQFSANTANDRIVLEHYLLANMGYDIRLGLQDNEFILLLATKTNVYARSFANIAGKRYYIYTDRDKAPTEGGSFSTCELPQDENLGKQMNFIIPNGLNLSSGDNKTVELSWKDMKVSAVIDNKVMEMLRHYPQMDIPMYAESTISESLHKSLLEQMKPYIQGLSERDAADKLLDFVQHAFQYATDGEQHGYEKAYFLEENFYYPKNDCEDRAIFYAFLVRNLLGDDVHLIQFPGHECTAVCFKDNSIQGDGYIYGGKTFTICDPTYIGASIGMCMPDFRNAIPKVETW